MHNEKINIDDADASIKEKTGAIRSAEILTIGTEILLGDLVDTNSAWLSSHLAALGVSLYRHTTVGDNSQR
ncbi:MAG TPA: molybdopterin-binding protein, partial [Rubrobacter sp.]|nr:molybdopterin-binding protein [Rubrobacter sp.]